MNVRDPFGIHRKNALSILKTTVPRAAVNFTERAVEASINALEKSKKAVDDIDMSFSVPKNVPSFSNPQRVVEDHVWGNTAVARGGKGSNPKNTGILGGVQDKVGSLFDDRNSLPMYKDKPYAYPPSYRARPLWRRKRIIGIVLLVILLLYYFGAFGRHHDTVVASTPIWAWLTANSGSGRSADWLGRRERVVEAFTLSWDAYERYAWGKIFNSNQRSRLYAQFLLTRLKAMMSFTRYPRKVTRWLREEWGGSSWML